MENLDSLREKMDKINLEILSLLNKRMEIALQIKEIKEKKQLPMHDPERENKMLIQLLEKNPGPLPSEDVSHLFKAIFECSLKNMSAFFS